jgi:hypothetical protein
VKGSDEPHNIHVGHIQKQVSYQYLFRYGGHHARARRNLRPMVIAVRMSVLDTRMKGTNERFTSMCGPCPGMCTEPSDALITPLRYDRYDGRDA